MKIHTLFSLAVTLSVSPVFAAAPATPLELLQQLVVPAGGECSVKQRSRQFSALGALPADTESFLAVSRIGELVAKAGMDASEVPGIGLIAELDSLAVGVSAGTTADIERLMPLIRALSAMQLQAKAERWSEAAHDSASRAIVAVQREQSEVTGEQLVQATQNLHLSPIYFVLTAQEGGDLLLQQLSVLPMLLPMTGDCAVEVTARGAWRGFCLHGNRLDLSAAGLSPEQEAAIKKNLENARLYVVASMVGKRLVFAICSNLDELKTPARHGESLLASPVMKGFDSCMSRNPWAVGYSSGAVVALRDKVNSFNHDIIADFAEKVFTRLGAETPACASAAAAIKSLRSLYEQFKPQQCGAERLVVWGEDDLYLQLTNSSCSRVFAPGAIRYAALAHDGNMAVYAESTPMQGLPAVEVSAVLDDAEAVHKGYLATLKPEIAEEQSASVKKFQNHRPLVEQVFALAQDCNARTLSSGALLVTAGAEGASAPASVSFRAEVSDAPEFAARLQSACSAAPCCKEAAPHVSVEGREVMLSFGEVSGAPVAQPVPVSGGVLFSVNFEALGRLMNQAELQEISTVVQGIDGAACTQGDECHTLLRVRLGDKQ